MKPDRRRLFVIDGSKALRRAIDVVYGQENPVQRCRNHKRKNVLDHVADSISYGSETSEVRWPSTGGLRVGFDLRHF